MKHRSPLQKVRECPNWRAQNQGWRKTHLPLSEEDLKNKWAKKKQNKAPQKSWTLPLRRSPSTGSSEADWTSWNQNKMEDMKPHGRYGFPTPPTYLHPQTPKLDEGSVEEVTKSPLEGPSFKTLGDKSILWLVDVKIWNPNTYEVRFLNKHFITKLSESFETFSCHLYEFRKRNLT